MKKLFTITLVAILSLQTHAANISQETLAKAQTIIDKAVDAYGGRDKLNALKQVQISSEVTNTANGQSLKPDPPWDKSYSSVFNAIDFDKNIYVSNVYQNDDFGEFNNKNINNGKNSLTANLINKTYSNYESEPADFIPAVGGFIRVTTPLLVKQLMQRAGTSTYLGEVSFNSKPHDVIRFVMEGPAVAMSLYFDQETHLLSKADRVLTFGLVEYFFSDYKMIDGVLFNQHYRLAFEGLDNTEQTNTISAINQPIDEHLVIDKNFKKLSATTTNEFKIEELADGVFFVGNARTYHMFVDMGDHLISIGGTASVEDKLAAVLEKTGDKPLKYGVLTHHHMDHIFAVGSLDDAGATILTVKENVAAINRSLNKDKKVKMEFVKSKRVFKSKNQTLEIIDIGPTPHVEHLLIAYLPKSGIVFEADHFGASATDPMNSASPSNKALAAAFKKHKLDVKRIASAHSPYVASIEKLDEAMAMAKSK